MVPEKILILLSGIPATRKSTFARYLSRKHTFAHYDLECYPGGWPHPELKQMWDVDRKSFIQLLCSLHKRVVLDWGFPVSCISWVEELRQCGVKLVWFDGDVCQAREEFLQRDGVERLPEFDNQVSAIQRAEYPISLNCTVIQALDSNGVFSDPLDIESSLFSDEVKE